MSTFTLERGHVPSKTAKVPLARAAALLGGLLGRAAARGGAGNGNRLMVAVAVAATASLLVRQLFDATPGVPVGSLVGNVGAGLALAALFALPGDARRVPVPSAILLSASALLLIGLVHAAYTAVDVRFGPGAATESLRFVRGVSSFELDLADAVGARTRLDVGLAVVASLGLLAGAAGVARRAVPRALRLALAAVATIALVLLLLLATGANPYVGGIDRFLGALLPIAALLAIAAACARATR